MGELQRIGAIADRRERVERLRTYVHAHAHDADGWYMLHIELEHAGELEGSEVARARAMATDPTVAARFSIKHAPVAPAPDGLEVPGYRVIRELYCGAGARLYEAAAPDGGRCMLRIASGKSIESIARIMERQQLATSYPGCLAVSRMVAASDGMPVQVVQWTDGLPIDARGGRLLGAPAVRKAIAAIAGILAAPHRDGLIAGDLRPCAVLGNLEQPDSLRVLGVRRPSGGSFGTLASDDGRFRWYATEEGAEQLDQRTDIYGLGLLLWWCVVGREPPELSERLKNRMPETGDAELDRIISRCTQVQPADRYASVDELSRDLVALEAPHAGPWLLGDRIGGGMTSDVYRATHAVDKRPAMVKVFTRRSNQEREHAALAALATVPGVARELDVSAPDIEHPYIALGPAPGMSLARLLARGALAPATAVAIVRRLATVLVGLHDAGVIHRDLCPDSVLVALDDPAAPTVTLIDFDAAKLRDRPDLDEPSLIGTPSHMAPEQWEVVPDVDERADVYALGLVFFECVTGRHPLTAGSLLTWQRAHLDPRRPRAVRDGLPPHLSTLIGQMIARERARRPGSMREVLGAFDAPPARRGWWDRMVASGPLQALRWWHWLAAGTALAAASIIGAWALRDPRPSIDRRPAVAAFDHTIVIATSSSVTARFDNRSTGSREGMQWLWTFGDGTSSTEETPTHEFRCRGGQASFTVSLRASNPVNPQGHTLSRADLIRISARPPRPPRVKATVLQGCREERSCEALFTPEPTPAAPTLRCEAPCRLGFQDESGNNQTQVCWQIGGAPERCGTSLQASAEYETPGFYRIRYRALYDCSAPHTVALLLQVTAVRPR